MLIILAIISFLTQYAIPKTIEDFPYQSNQTCDECYRIYVPLCASDNETYTNECRFRCIMSKKQVEDRARIVRSAEGV
ncbi:hypothetical protein B5X24_HaOG204048 [Helicoverpa armigera]|uniref:Kazal-like domain-containing protein n=1 Tax=Helicoverpa armigera TaxID=29058 RepID=A0A2W1BW32_HELAM|nr:hypothetical protein B5X24_HaOG204048 [Helicoverpa armigera]